MDFFSSLYGSMVQPLGSGPTVAGAPASTTPASSGSGFSFSGLLSGLSDMAGKGISAYRNFTAPTAAQTAQAKTASYMPLILMGGGVLVVLVILVLLLRRR